MSEVQLNDNQYSMGSVDNINNKEVYRSTVQLSFEVETFGTSEEDVREQLEKTHPTDLYAMNIDSIGVKVEDISNMSQIEKDFEDNSKDFEKEGE